MRKVALIVAGGKGERMKSDIPKQFLLLKELPILMHTIKQFSHFEKIVLVLPSSQFKYWENLCKNYKFTQKHTLVAGGKNRFKSVENGLDIIPNNRLVAIHDGVRPFVSKALIDKLISATIKGAGIVPVIAIKDSIRKVEEEKSAHVDRKNLYKVQTPQCFLSSDIKKTYKKVCFKTFTDDASVFEKNGGKIKTLLGEEKNIKITTEEDLKIASALFV